MRVIAGVARGVPLEPPGSLAVRPTLDRVREALFSILTPRIKGAQFLDLFAGTGANGIEALSRGASSATFIESDPQTAALIRRNLAKTRLHACARVVTARIPEGLAALTRYEQAYDIVYLDPPHDYGPLQPLLEHVHDMVALNTQAMVVIEHATSAVAPCSVKSWTRSRQARYGRTTLSFFAG